MRGLTFRYVLEVLIPGYLDTRVQGAGLVGYTGRDHVSCDGLQPITTCSITNTGMLQVMIAAMDMVTQSHSQTSQQSGNETHLPFNVCCCTVLSAGLASTRCSDSAL